MLCVKAVVSIKIRVLPFALYGLKWDGNDHNVNDVEIAGSSDEFLASH